MVAAPDPLGEVDAPPHPHRHRPGLLRPADRHQHGDVLPAEDPPRRRLLDDRLHLLERHHRRRGPRSARPSACGWSAGSSAATWASTRNRASPSSCCALALVFAFGIAPYTLADGTISAEIPAFWPWLVVILVSLFVFAKQSGTVNWVLVSEIFPARIRGVAQGFAVGCGWLMNAVVSYVFPVMITHLGAAWTYAAFRGDQRGVALLPPVHRPGDEGRIAGEARGAFRPEVRGLRAFAPARAARPASSTGSGTRPRRRSRRSRLRRVGYPLVAPPARPATMYLCNAMKIRRTGVAMRAATAIR